ncbi:MAG: prepilin-type N-terminal cleavage/methylation domain-containing protein [Pirellulales bacterium]
MKKRLSYIARPSWSGKPNQRLGRMGTRRSRPRWLGYVINAGFTLLEIILALAILAGSLVALGEVMRLGDQNASNARDETEAEILASSVMDEILSGVREYSVYDKQDFDYETDPRWLFSVVIEPTNFTELVRVGVRVEQAIDSEKEPVHYELYRWILNPDYVTQIEQEEAQIASQAAASANAQTNAGGGP